MSTFIGQPSGSDTREKTALTARAPGSAHAARLANRTQGRSGIASLAEIDVTRSWRQINPAPRAHLYLAPSTATGISVE
jgi:hypothetical protein